MQANTSKRKYKIDEFTKAERANPIIQNFSTEKQILTCICCNKSDQGYTCFKCQQFVHKCLAPTNNRENLYECASCLNRNLDPLFPVAKVLFETYARTESIFTYSNMITFEFFLKPEDRQNHQFVEIRCIHSGMVSLGWPMQGSFSLNDEKANFIDFKPLLSNSNRKKRKEEYFLVPDSQLRIGKNILKFKIPCLDKHKFIASYQYEEKKEYFFAINLVKKLTPNELQKQTFQIRRTELKDSLNLLNQNQSDIEIFQHKVNLMCPYTKERIRVPIRGRYCKHFSVICLQTLITYHQLTRQWNCPICEAKIFEPYVDIFIYGMLIDNSRGCEVTVKTDGSYEWIRDQNDDAVDLESEESIFNVLQLSEPKNEPAKKQAEKEPEKAKMVIDILDDDEDQPVPQPQTPQRLQQPQPPQVERSNNQPLLSEEEIIEEDQVQDRREADMRKRKQALKKLKEKHHKSHSLDISKESKSKDKPIQRRNIMEFEGQNQHEIGKRQSFLSHEFKHIHEVSKEMMSKSKNEPLLYDVKHIVVRELRFEEFRKRYFRNKENKYKMYIKREEIRKLFKELS